MTSALSDRALAQLLELGFDEESGEPQLGGVQPGYDQTWPYDAASRGEPAPASVPKHLGEYELLRVLDSGGMGIVWEARRVGGGLVALKLLRPELLYSDREVERFYNTAEDAARLNHPHIARVLHVSRSRAQPFVVMDLVSGGPITAERLSPPETAELGLWSALVSRLVGTSVPPEQRRVAALMLKVTEAVNFAHQHGLLHRDLKPSNILLDSTGEPKLVDFGLARRLGQSYGSVTSRVIEGALDYMGPEQARGVFESLTVVADVYSLGATLYELLTGRVPFHADSESELLELIKSDVPVTPPRELVPSVHPFLEAVCLRCLEKQPHRRYQSAEALANDLRRVVNGDAPAVSSLSARKRLGHWVRRHPASAKRVLSTVVLLCLVVGMLLSLWQDRTRREREALRSNAAIASGQAAAILFQLSYYANRLEMAAKLVDVPDYASRESYQEDPAPAFKAASEGFDTLFVVAADGLVRAQWPPSEKWIWRRNYEFRDYYIGARELGERGSREVHVAKAFRSERDGELKFGISTPVYDGSRWVGVLVALISADSVFGKVQLPKGSNSTAALLGPRDRERDGRARPPFVFLIHDQLRKGEEVAVPDVGEPHRLAHREVGAAALQLRYTAPTGRSDYIDPLYGPVSWVAAFAPVGATGYVVVSQSR